MVWAMMPQTEHPMNKWAIKQGLIVFTDPMRPFYIGIYGSATRELTQFLTYIVEFTYYYDGNAWIGLN
jgi:hypothetical protein